MLSASQEMLEMFGVCKRMADVERILSGLDAQLRLERNFSATSQKCHFIAYDWGHVIVYSYPEESLMTCDIFSSESSLLVDAIRRTLLEVFQPRRYLCFDQLRTAGGRAND